MLDSYENLDLPRAERYQWNGRDCDEIPIIKKDDWVISHGMFGLAGFKQTEGGFLWQVIEVFQKETTKYWKAKVKCADSGEESILSLSMLYLCPAPPSEKLLKEYKETYNTWLNKP